MIKRMTIFPRRQDLTRAAFSAHWKGPHRAIALGMPGIDRYNQNHVIETWPVAGKGFDLDGIVELWFADQAAMERALASPAAAELPPDERNFMGAITICRIEEFASPPTGSGKLILVASRDPGADQATFEASVRQWLADGGVPSGHRVVGINRVLATSTRNTLPGAGEPAIIATVHCLDTGTATSSAEALARSPDRPGSLVDASLFLVEEFRVV